MNKTGFEKYKQETLELVNRKKQFLAIGLVLLGVALILFILGIITFVAAKDGQFHYIAADILLILAFNFLLGGIVMLILRKAIFDRKLKERERLINKEIENRKAKKIHHNDQ